MAMSQKERDVRRAEKAARTQEVMLRLPVRPGTRKALQELMEWASVEEQAEAMTLMIHRLHELGREKAVHFLTPPKLHNPRPSRIVELAFERKSVLMIQQDPGDEILAP
jgi:hypothetical protein